jgi:hypothetical protein
VANEASKTYYKAVRLAEDGRMESVFAGGTARMEYVIGKRTLPLRGTGLLAFGSAEDARLFLLVHCTICPRGPKTTGFRILCGKGEERNLGLPVGDAGWGDDEAAEKIALAWATRQGSGRRYWPLGTVALNWFEPEGIASCETD